MRRSLIWLPLVVLTLAIACSQNGGTPSTPTQPNPTPLCSVTPATLDLGSLIIGSHHDTSFTVTNTGGGTLSGTVTDTSSVFTIIGTTSFSLGAGQSATFTVRFVPVASGLRTCTLAVGSSCSLTCRGVGTSPPLLACDVSPSALDFGTVPLGQEVDRTFTLTNRSSEALTGTVSTNCSDFAIPGSTAYNLTPSQSATFIVRLSPTRAGPLSCLVNTGSPSCPTVSCTGTGEEVCAASPTAIDFGTVTVGQSKDTTFTIRNVGSGTLSGTVSLASCGAAFGIVGSPMYALSPGQVATIRIRFNPTVGIGGYGCTVIPGTGCPAIQCSGTAKFPDVVANCFVSPTELDFGDVVVGQSSTLIFQIRNGYRDPGPQLSGLITVTGPGFSSQDHGYVVDPEHVVNVAVEFAPSSLGPATGLASITQAGCSYCGASCTSVTLTGNGTTVQPPPACAVSSTDIQMGTIYSYQVKDTTFSITNTGGQTLSGFVSFPGSHPQFSFLGPTSYALLGGESQDFTVRFTAPILEQSQTASHVQGIDLGVPCSSIGLIYVAASALPAPPSCTASPATLDFGSVPVGQSKDLSLTITNVGGGTLGDSLIVDPAFRADFAILGSQYYSLQHGESATFTVRFTPQAATYIATAIRPKSRGCWVPMSGTGI